MIDWGGKVAAWFFGVGVFAITMALYLGSAVHPWRGWRHDLVDALFCVAAACMVGCLLTGPAAIALLVRRNRLKKAEQVPEVPGGAEGGVLPSGAGEDELVVVGEIPQEPLCFQPRADLLAELDEPSSGRGVCRWFMR